MGPIYLSLTCGYWLSLHERAAVDLGEEAALPDAREPSYQERRHPDSVQEAPLRADFDQHGLTVLAQAGAALAPRRWGSKTADSAAHVYQRNPLKPFL